MLQYRCVEEVCLSASQWFRCFASLPYDATFRLEALLDCLEFFMGNRYLKYQLIDVWKIELLQLGFGFTNSVGRRQWVLTIESLLYTFNVQCKFMMPCKYQQPDLLVLDHFSHFRGLAAGEFTAVDQLREPKHAELDKEGMQVCLRYFSMPSSIDYDLHGVQAYQKPTALTLGALFFWQKCLSQLKREFRTYSIKPIDLPIDVKQLKQIPYEPDQLELNIAA